jgi:hypothetical protein
MSWTTNPKPGSAAGPCIGACKHLDCAGLRASAEALCYYCKKPIGYETPWVMIGTTLKDGAKGEPAHFNCGQNLSGGPPVREPPGKRRDRILARLKELGELKPEAGEEAGHTEADQLLLELINDVEISAAFATIPKWYA